ncbi:MAG TPA: hypothetical protein EYP02_01045 [Sulfurovum sp.]|nr:hypothetical protein [Sulfurovum sp.]
MSKYFSILLSLFVLIVVTFVVVNLKSERVDIIKIPDIGEFEKKKTCAIQPLFLTKLRVPQPIAVDLSQQQYRGVAFLFGPNLSQSVHPKSWKRFDHFSSYILDPKGHMYLTPMPYITVEPNTFEFQKSIYKLNSNSGKLDIWTTLDEVKAGANNPFGLIALDYDCADDTLWVSAIDESSYTEAKGIIYHIDVQSKKILQRVEVIDALSVKLLESKKGKYLLTGSARDNKLYAYEIKNRELSSTPIELLELPDFNERVRKINIMGKNSLRLETIPFTYTLIAETGEEQSVRENYDVKWNPNLTVWEIKNGKSSR